METTKRVKKPKRKSIKSSDDVYKAYICQIKKTPLLTFSEELELSRRIQNGDEEARRQLIEANLRFVVKIARTYFPKDINSMDLIQEGNMGLMRAAEKFDHRKELRFSTYAAWWIRQSISRYLSDKQRLIRLPHRKEDMLRRIQQAYYALLQMYMRKPNIDEVADEIGVSKECVEFILSFSYDTVSMDTIYDDGESTGVIEYIEDHTYSPDRALFRKSIREAAIKALDILKDRERNVMIYRYQLNGEKQHSLKNIAEKMGLSTEAIRQIEFRALRKLRRHADELRRNIEAI